MSSKNKLAKQQAVSKYENPINIQLIIDTDDDFLVNGETIFSLNLVVENKNEIKSSIIQSIEKLKFSSHPNNNYKINNFKDMLNSSEFIEQLDYLMLDSNHDDYTNNLSVGGNQTISIHVF